jgi:hypothetical protein
MVYADRSRLKSGVGREAMRKRGEMVKRSFAHILDRRGMRRAWLRGRENVHRRCLIHVAGFNLGILMPAIFEQGTPRFRFPQRGRRGTKNPALASVSREPSSLVLGFHESVAHPPQGYVSLAPRRSSPQPDSPHRERLAQR